MGQSELGEGRRCPWGYGGRVSVSGDHGDRGRPCPAKEAGVKEAQE